MSVRTTIIRTLHFSLPIAVSKRRGTVKSSVYLGPNCIQPVPISNKIGIAIKQMLTSRAHVDKFRAGFFMATKAAKKSGLSKNKLPPNVLVARKGKG